MGNPHLKLGSLVWINIAISKADKWTAPYNAGVKLLSTQGKFGSNVSFGERILRPEYADEEAPHEKNKEKTYHAPWIISKQSDIC